MEPSEKHWLGRPPEGAENVERWTGAIWIKDDGKPGLAFSGELMSHQSKVLFPYAWGPDCVCFDSFIGPHCPSRIASKRTYDRFGCSNGSNMQKT